jgi:TIR domain/Effector-associated domain 1
MALILEELINNKLLDELADCFNDETGALMILRSISFPTGSIPSFTKAENSLDFWFKVCEQIDKGRVPGGFEPLLKACARHLPGNKIFAPFGGSKTKPVTAPGYPAQASPTLSHVSDDFYHCFISYYSKYRDEVKAIDQSLRDRAVKPWMDVHDMGLGRAFVGEIEQILSQVKVFVACIGAADLGNWQTPEVEIALSNAVRGRCTIIPVMLSDISDPNLLPAFIGRLNGIRIAGDGADAPTLDRLARSILQLNDGSGATSARS